MSRIKIKLSGNPLDLQETLLARMVDELAFLAWSKTKDGSKNRNRPPSVLKALTEPKKESEYKTFKSADDFMSAWNDIVGRK